MSNVAWIIDVDHLPSPDAEPGTNLNAVGVMGPSDMHPGLAGLLTESVENGRKFRLFDDDQNLIYEGRILTSNKKGELTEGTEADFAPLDDFGMPNSGCTYIEYLSEAGVWEVL